MTIIKRPGLFRVERDGWTYLCIWDQRWPGYRSDTWIEVVW